jgi:hypothetical protein
MSARRRALRRNKKGNRCFVCGAPDDDDTRFYFMFRAPTKADRDQLVAYVYRRTDDTVPPVLVGPVLVRMCPEHTDYAVIQAGFVPPAMVQSIGNLSEVYDSWIEANWHRLRLPGSSGDYSGPDAA